MSIESLIWKNLPTSTGGIVHETNSIMNRDMTIKCTSTNRTWNIKYTNKYRSDAIFDEIMEPVMKKFPFLRKYDLSNCGVTSVTSLDTHNRIAVPLTANMMWHGLRDGKNDGKNKYASHSRSPVFTWSERQDVNSVVFIGDSWTADEMYPSTVGPKLEYGYNVTCDYKGVEGSTSSDIKNSFNNEINSHDMVICTVGVNDYANGIPVSSSFENIKYMIDQTRTKGKKLIIASYCKLGTALPSTVDTTLANMIYGTRNFLLNSSTGLDKLIKQYLSGKGWEDQIAYIDYYNDTSLAYDDHPEFWLSDCLHLNKYGTKLYALKITEKAEEFINQHTVYSSGSAYTPVFTTDEIWNKKEKVPYGRKWSEMV